MKKHDGQINGFVDQVRRRISHHRWWCSLVYAGLGGALVMLAIASSYIFRGRHVPAFWYLVVFAAILAAAGIWWLFRRVSCQDAARCIDESFDLKDSVTSYLGFSKAGRKAGLYGLQADKTGRMVDARDASEIPLRLPARLAVLAGVMLLTAGLLGLKDDSELVKQRLADEKAAAEITDQLNQQLTEQLEELIKQAKDQDCEQLIKPDELRKMVAQLESKKDRKDGMRQYARLEKEIRKMSNRLQQRKDEQLLKKAARELEKDRQTKELADKLDKKQFKDAAKDLAKFKMTSDKQLSEQMKQLARLKALSQRMSMAANNSKSSSSKSSSGNCGKSSAGNCQKSGGNCGSENSELAQMISQLDDKVSQLDKQLKLAAHEKKNTGQMSEKTCKSCQSSCKSANDSLENLSRKLCRMSAKKKAMNNLESFCRKLGQCQSMCRKSGMCQSAGKAQGKGIGMGTDQTENNSLTQDNKEGYTTALKGIKGQGPSLTMVEAADDGQGVSTRKSVARQRQFKRQFESFVQRQDVPEDVKDGVKIYFENIHKFEIRN